MKSLLCVAVVLSVGGLTVATKTTIVQRLDLKTAELWGGKEGDLGDWLSQFQGMEWMKPPPEAHTPKLHQNSRGPRKIATTRWMPRNCLRMIPLCSRFDSLAFTSDPFPIGGEINFSRSPPINGKL